MGSVTAAVLLLIMASGSSGAQARGAFKTSDGVTLSYLEARPVTSGEKHLAIVFVPGWCMPAWLWRSQLEHLGRRFHTLALDPRGQGDSEVPASGYTTERRAVDIKEFIERFPKLLLVGWSLGAIESLQYVHMFGSDRLAGLALVDSSVGENPVPASAGQFQQELRENREKALRQFAQAIFSRRRSDKEIAALVDAASRMSLENSLALLDSQFDRSHWREITRKFEKPLLYAITPQYQEQGRNLKKYRPATQVELFAKAGHALFVDEPARFNRLIESFANKLLR